jgi:hypothetical protein
MSGGLSDLRNYNVGFQVFLAAIKEYSKYIYGLDSGLFKKYLTDPNPIGLEAVDDLTKQDVKVLMANILDRTVGANTIFGLSKILAPGSWPEENIIHRSDVIISCWNDADAGVSNITTSQLATSQAALEALGPDAITPGATISMYDVVKSAFGPKPKGDAPDTRTPFENDFLNKNKDSKSIDRFGSPTLSAHVIRQTEFNVSGRQAQHLPIFFSAIPAIEMSRCTPFLDIKFIHPSYASEDDAPASPKMSATNLFRFDPSATFDGVIPQGSTTTDVDEIAGSNFSFMDLFSSTQVAVNANINSEDNSFVTIASDFKNLHNDDGAERIEDRRVLDPFQPFLSLISMDLTEQGKYGGFLATREGSIKLKLHDKSRLRDFSPMLALDEYSFAYFVIEMGWSHPEGKLLSNNTIGQYLDNLRTVNSYNITGVNYSLGKDNSVDITLNIVTRGAKSVVPKVSAFSGYYSNLSVFEGLINSSIANYEKLNNTGVDKKVRSIKEIRNKIRVQTGNMSSLSKLVPFATLQEVKKLSDLIKEPDSKFYEKLSALLGVVPSADETKTKPAESPDADVAKAALAPGRFASPGDVFENKFSWLSKTVDPFECATRFEDSVTTEMWRSAGKSEAHPSIKEYYEVAQLNSEDEVVPGSTKHVTLGKLISKFVGFPLSTCGIYDEVQIYFYPVNNHAAGARRHTTASIPIELSVLSNEFNKIREKKGRDEPNYAFSVEGFIKTCQRILMKQELSAYRLAPDSNPESKDYSSYNTISQAYLALSRDQKIAFLKGGNLDTADGDNPGIEVDTPQLFTDIGFKNFTPTATLDAVGKQAEENKVNSEFLEKLSKHKKESFSALLTEMYEDESLSGMAAAGPIFTPINLQVFFETCPAVDDELDTSTQNLKDAFKSLAHNAIFGSTLDSDGILVDKNILKLHVYDSNTITYPNIAVHGLGTKDSAPVIDSGGEGEPEWLSKIKAAAEDPEVKNNYNWWKTIIASKYPTIIHGSANSTIKDINISSNISGDLKTIKIIDAQEKNFNRQFTDELDEKFDETLFFPSSVVIQMMGMPCINRGASIFVDMGTGTSLDNIYSVSSVTHSITPGDFTTTLNCIAPNQNIVQSTRSNYIERIKSGLKK